MVVVRLEDGKQRRYNRGVTLLQVAEDISPKLAKNALVGCLDGEPVDLLTGIEQDSDVRLVDFEDELGRDVYRHTSAHILAQAIKRLWPDSQLAIGPSIEKGFYYDIESDHVFTPDDFNLIEEEAKKIIKADYQIIRSECPGMRH